MFATFDQAYRRAFGRTRGDKGGQERRVCYVMVSYTAILRNRAHLPAQVPDSLCEYLTLCDFGKAGQKRRPVLRSVVVTQM